METHDNGAATRRRWKHTPAVGLALATFAAGLLASGSAQANSEVVSGTPLAASDLPQEVVKVDTAEAASLGSGRPKVRIRFHFKKNRENPANSRLILQRVTLRGDLPPQYLRLGEWRAGSGVGSQPGGRDECASKRGWLPNGRYDAHSDGPAHDTNFDGGVIFGIVWRLQDKKCHGAADVTRTELFIHSEMTPDRKQRCKTGDYREDQCWDGRQDYLSEGCIKLSNKAIREAAKLARAWGGPKPDQKHYRDLLIVTG